MALVQTVRLVEKRRGWRSKQLRQLRVDIIGASPVSWSGTDCGYACHTIVTAKDYIFTAYPKR
jgi:hypothetical protein